MYSWYDAIRMTIYFCGTLPKAHNPVSSWDKHQKNPIWEYSTKYLISTPQNSEGHQKQEKSKTLS